MGELLTAAFGPRERAMAAVTTLRTGSAEDRNPARGGRPSGGGGWIFCVDSDQAWAAADVTRAVAELEVSAGGMLSVAVGLRAVDPARIKVDGGRGPSTCLGGRVSLSDAVGRWRAYVAEVRTRDLKARVVRGRRQSLFVDVLLRRVICEGTAASLLDRELGVREGRCQQTVLRELSGYAAAHRIKKPLDRAGRF